MTAVVLVYLIAFWAILRGIAEIVVATQVGREAGREFLLILAGVLSVLFGVAIIFFPGAGIIAIVWLIGVYAIVLGILLVAGAFRIRTWVRVGRPQLS
jgi:uncharacterized membrane protein HdeD (DUF308 family)